MKREAAGPEAEARLQDVLERWYARAGEGGVDLLELCAGDAELARRAQELIDGEARAARTLSGLAQPERPEERDIARVGDFRIRALLGRGGMGRVFLAEQESLGRLVALKVLDRSSLADEESRRRFHREAAIAATLDHPNIVPVHAFGEDEGYAWIAMKWLPGPSLDALGAGGDPRLVARIGLDVARALEEAHLSGVVHRDIKPGNVIMDGDRPCIVDFGLARAPSDATLTRQGTVPGTLAYMAPEQLRGERTGPDARADVYSLGVTLYELLCGRRPFPSDAPERLIHQILFTEPKAPGLPARDRDLETIVLRAMEKDAHRRFPSAAALADDLQRYLDGVAIHSRPATVLTRMVKLARRHPRATLLGGAAGLALLVLAVTLLLVVLDERATLQERLDGAERALVARDVERAGTLVEALVSSNPEDERVAGIAERLQAVLALERLLDQVQDRREAQNPRLLEKLAGALAARAQLTHLPELTACALAAAAIHQGYEQEARRRLAELARPGPATRALLAVLDGTRPEPPPADASADERLLVALALRLAQRPLAEQQACIEGALRADPHSTRSKYALAIQLDRGGRYEAALAVLQTLRGGSFREPALLRKAARLNMIQGRLEAARSCLDAVPASDWSVVDEHQRLLLMAREGHWDDVADALERALLRWPDEPELSLVAAQAALRRGDRDEARRNFARVAARKGWAFYREKARASLLLMDLQEIPGSERLANLGREEPRLKAIAQRAADLAAEARENLPRSLALHVLFKARLLSGEEGAEDALDQAIAAAPDNPAPRVDAASLAMARVMAHLQGARAAGQPAASFSDPALGDLGTWARLAPLAIRGRAHARAVIAGEGRGVQPPSARQLEQANLVVAWLGTLLQDHAEARAAARRALELMQRRGADDAASKQWRRVLEGIAKR